MVGGASRSLHMCRLINNDLASAILVFETKLVLPSLHYGCHDSYSVKRCEMEDTRHLDILGRSTSSAVLESPVQCSASNIMPAVTRNQSAKVGNKTAS